MDIFETMKARHSVRTYNNRKIEPNVVKELHMLIDQCNKDSGLHIQLCLDEPNAFDGFMAHYGKFNNVKNYIALIGKKSKDFDEKIGYYGEKIVLKATELGLGSCWVAMSYSKSKCSAAIDKDEKLICVISLGYFDKDGVPHKTKSIEELSRVNSNMPDWFRSGMEAAQLAPTAMNQQKFLFILDGNKVTAKAGMGFYAKLDLGIAKYHFELGAGIENFKWSN
ncbi:nitroreductase family protein [Candidatus Clostridium radicumherbarum]|uniref:Nitroreductase family protein n=1 Tax=Candidatus Clostridium radicumherbarum TaxID=3381662 RepID=A0ABW8TT77_9CLOT